MPESPPSPRVISRLFDAVYPSFAMLAGMELDLFTPLTDGPLTTEELAEGLNVQPEKLRPLLNALAIAGLLTLTGSSYSNTPEADHYLVRGRPDYLGGMQELTSNNWRRVLRMAETIRAGGPPAEYDYHSESQAELIALLRGLIPGAQRDAQKLQELYDFSFYDTLLDVGGGSGALAIAMVQTNPGLKATVVDLPTITPITRHFVEEANAADRIKIVSADVTSQVLPESYDVIVARHLIQVLSEEDSRALLSNLAEALQPGGLLYLVGWVLDDTRLSPEKTVGYNLILLNAYPDGQAYTESEYRSWLEGAGLAEFKRTVMSDGSSIVKAWKPL